MYQDLVDHGKRFKLSIILLLFAIFGGTLGYMVIENFDFLSSLYMSVITLSTVGFKEVEPLGKEGMVFTIFLILFGVGTVAYGLSNFVQMGVEGELRTILGRKRLEKNISKLENHYIICGYGRMGKLICEDLYAHGIKFVLVEKEDELLLEAGQRGYLYIRGDATEERTLILAGIMKAKGLVTVLASDADNLYVTLSARGLNPNLFILARATDERVESKMLKAGASRVISPYVIGAARITNLIIRPNIVDFIEITLRNRNFELQMEEVKVEKNSILCEKSIKESNIRYEFGVIVVAIKRGDGMIFNPLPSVTIKAGDILIVLGERKNIEKFERVAKG